MGLNTHPLRGADIDTGSAFWFGFRTPVRRDVEGTFIDGLRPLREDSSVRGDRSSVASGKLRGKILGTGDAGGGTGEDTGGGLGEDTGAGDTRVGSERGFALLRFCGGFLFGLQRALIATSS